MGEDDEKTGETLVGFVSGHKPVVTPPTSPTPTDSLTPATSRIGGRYEILGQLGIGGMGAVYKVRDLELDEIVALKRLRDDLANAPGMLARFRQEVKLARRVTHKNVVRTFDLGEDGAERYLTMEYVDGRSLARVLAAEGALPTARAVDYGVQICAGVTAAHTAGVLHRDLKPDNVLVAAEGDGERVVITDFGIARAAKEAGLLKTVGGAVGTPAYMAPEQVRGQDDVDGRADVYAIGAMLFEMVTGRRAWPGEDPFAVAFARLDRPPPDPRDVRAVPEAVAVVVVKAMARDPRDRYASAGELGAALAAVRSAVTSSAPSASTPLPRRAPASVPTPSARAVAVLPFRNAGPPDDAYLADGLTEELIDALSMTRNLRVRPHGAVAHLAGQHGDPGELGRQLDVQVVVDGTVRRFGERLRISARLVSVDDGFQLWAKKWDVAPADVLSTTEEASKAIAAALTVDLGGGRAGPADPVAVELYLRGKHALRKTWTGGTESASALLEQALDRAPDDPAILAAYASARAREAFFGHQGQQALLEIARQAAERAVAVAPRSGEAWLATADVRRTLIDLPGAAQALRRALEASPNLARAQEGLGSILLEAGRVDEAFLRLRTAWSLDPGSVGPRWELVRGHALLGDWAQVDEMLTSSRDAEDDPRSFAILVARFAFWRPGGMPQLAQVGPVAPSAGDAPSVLMSLRYYQIARATLKTGSLTADDRAFIGGVPAIPNKRMRALASQLSSEVAAWVGDVELAFELLEEAVRSGLEDFLWMERCPPLAPLRADPRWAPLRNVLAERAAKVLRAVDQA